MTDTIQDVLRFEQVCYRSPSDSFASFTDASFSLARGDLAVIHIDHDSEHVPIADLATGLIAPTIGHIFFEGRDWESISVFEQSAARGRNGCVLEKPSWISSLTVVQNMLLRERHHTSRSETDIEAEALEYCKLIGVDAIPRLRPDKIRSRELRLFEWVRACLGTPELIVLMFPDRGAFSGACRACADLIKHLRDAGSAILLVSDRIDDWRSARMDFRYQFQIRNERWTPMNEETQE